MRKMNIILGLPDVLRNFLDAFVAMLRDAGKILDSIEIALAQTEAQIDVVVPLSDIVDAVSMSSPMQKMRLGFGVMVTIQRHRKSWKHRSHSIFLQYFSLWRFHTKKLRRSTSESWMIT